MKDNQKIAVTGLDIRIGIAIMLSLLVCHVASMMGIQLQSLAACTGAVMCVQDNGKASWKAGLTRLLGVVCGGVVGIVVVLIQSRFDNVYLFMILCGAAVVVNLLLCRIVKMPYVTARVSCMTFLLVVLVLQGTARINYAVGRFLGTLIGALVSLLVTVGWDVIAQEKSDAVSTR